MKHLQIFSSYEVFDKAKENVDLPYIAINGEHTHYSANLHLGADGVENGYGWIDLGLPSGIKWAQCNIGATTPCDPGLLFQWGRVDGYEYGYPDNQFSNDNPPNTTSGKKYIDYEILYKEDDAASFNMGGKWRMPTDSEILELIDNTTSSWVTCNIEHEGTHTTIPGRLFISKKDKSKKLFFPAAGWRDNWYRSFADKGKYGNYWTSHCYTDHSDMARKLTFSSSDVSDYSDACRCANSIRGVCYNETVGEDGIENGYEYVDLGLPSGLKWAKCNIGATSEIDYGLYFQWGRVDGYAYDDENHQFISFNSYTTASGKSYTNGETLNPEDDAATVNMGNKWRMPTKEDIEELIDNTFAHCTTYDIEHEGTHTTISGILFESKKDRSKKLFIPNAGCYDGNSAFCDKDLYCYIWTSICDNSYGYMFYHNNTYGYVPHRSSNISSRGVQYGFPIRGVCK